MLVNVFTFAFGQREDRVVLENTTLEPVQLEKIIPRDTTRIPRAQHIIGLSSSAVYNSLPTASFHIYKAKLSYSNFITPNFQASGGVTLYQTWSNFNAFDKSVMFNVDLLGKFYWRKFHADLGLHPGNYAEFIQDLDSRPKLMLYTSLGGGITIPIAKKFTIDLEFRKLFAINRFPKFEGHSPLEAFIGVGYVIDGSNQRFRRTKAKIRVSRILTEKSHLVGYGFSAGAFDWPTDEGVPVTYMLNNFSYQYFPKKNWSVSANILSSFIYGSAQTVNGIDKKYFKTFNIGVGSRYNIGALFAGGLLSLGNYSAFKEDGYLDRKSRFYLKPELGVNLKITRSILFEFNTRYAISLNQLFDRSDPSTNYIIGTVGINVKLNAWKEGGRITRTK